MKPGAHLLDDEKLIEAVKRRPFMYDVDDPQHNYRPLLFKSWREIAQEVGHEVHTVKDRWISMRDYYRKKVRELEKIKSGQLDKKFKKWSLYDKLDFLKPYLRHIEIDNTSTPANSGNGSRNDSDVDSEEEGVQLALIKAENTDEDEDENQSDDSYRRDVVQALDSGYGSLDVSLSGGKKSNKVLNNGRSSSRTVRRRAAYLNQDDSLATPAGPSPKKQRSEWTPQAAAKPSRLSPVSVEDFGIEVNTNQHFFASLIPMIETLDSITAMEFRHEVHGVLLRYLKEERDRQRTKASQGTASSSSSARFVEQNESCHAIIEVSVNDKNNQSNC